MKIEIITDNLEDIVSELECLVNGWTNLDMISLKKSFKLILDNIEDNNELPEFIKEQLFEKHMSSFLKEKKKDSRIESIKIIIEELNKLL